MEVQAQACEHFVLVAAMNPCPCGYYGDPVKECTCSLGMVSKYQKRISGPLLDRDRHVKRVQVPRVEYDKLADDRLGEPSADVQARVEAARALWRPGGAHRPQAHLQRRYAARRRAGTLKQTKRTRQKLIPQSYGTSVFVSSSSMV